MITAQGVAQGSGGAPARPRLKWSFLPVKLCATNCPGFRLILGPGRPAFSCARGTGGSGAAEGCGGARVKQEEEARAMARATASPISSPLAKANRRARPSLCPYHPCPRDPKKL
jgi:hypothetical protein